MFRARAVAGLLLVGLGPQAAGLLFSWGCQSESKLIMGRAEILGLMPTHWCVELGPSVSGCRVLWGECRAGA